MFGDRSGKRGADAARFKDRLRKVANETLPPASPKANLFTPRGDRRAAGSTRTSLFVPGTIVQASGARHPVVVANLSEGGAELRSMRALGVLRNFELLVPSHGVRRKARTAWRGDGVFGVAFED